MRPRLKGTIIFVFSDPGGAKPCLSLIEENNISNAIAISDREYPFYSDFKTNVKIIIGNYENLIDQIQPDIIFTGTSYTSNIEKQFIKISKNNKIPCYSFVDHWTNISKRFEDQNGEIILPDKLWLIDERAQQIALKEGIVKTKILITGNPYHDWLKKWKPQISKDLFFKQLGINHTNKKILIYAPDPLSNIKGSDIYGFDELTVTTLLVKLFSNHEQDLKDWLFLVKLHPNQNREKINKLFLNKSFFRVLPSNVNVNTSIIYSDVILGFFSSFLIEASIMNKPVLRFLEKEISCDPILDLNIGTVVNKDTIIRTLINIFNEN